MSGGEWDPWPAHRELARLSAARWRFRMRRTLGRIRSPRRIVATGLAVLFFLLYLLNGIFILSARQPADPERLRLWLSGGMVLYAVYHCVRCSWSNNVSDLELTPAETLWLGGAPLKRSSLAVYHVGQMVVPAALKTMLLAVVLAIDVEHLELLCVGVFTSLLLLEIVRLAIVRWTVALGAQGQNRFRSVATLVASAVALQVAMRVIATTPMGSGTLAYLLAVFRCLGETAACDVIQLLSLPWVAGAQMAVASDYGGVTAAQMLIAIGMLPMAIVFLIRVDRWAIAARHHREQQRLLSGEFHSAKQRAENKCPTPFAGNRPFGCFAQKGSDTFFSPISKSESEKRIDVSLGRFDSFMTRSCPGFMSDMAAVVSRQWVSVKRYWSTIAFSFVIPTLLCLSPLATGQVVEQWFFVVGGIGMCTMLLAPPALRIDFRRDLRRMMLLRSLPITPLSMVLGQLTLPVLITCSFQWLTIAVAAMITQPGWSAVVLWTGTLNALALFTFAAENALFLAYPHHERTEGVSMMVRAKLTFLGKALALSTALAVLVAWGMFCHAVCASAMVMPIFITGAIVGTWSFAISAVVIAAGCWRRFDLSLDVPPQ